MDLRIAVDALELEEQRTGGLLGAQLEVLPVVVHAAMVVAARASRGGVGPAPFAEHGVVRNHNGRELTVAPREFPPIAEARPFHGAP